MQIASLRVGVVSAAITFATAPLVRKMMIRFNTMDVPNHRSSHTLPTPRGGGLAVLAGYLGAACVRPHPLTVGTAVSALTLTAVGCADDLTTSSGGISPKARLIAQGIAGLASAGNPGVIPHVVASFGTTGVVNIVNFMDGINGITALTALVWGVNAASSHNPELSWIGAATAGAGVGFLPWNAPHAQLFLGDTGSYLLGSIIASGIIRAFAGPERARTTVVIAAPLVPYAADAAQALIRRYRRAEPITEAHREHVYQQLVDHTRLSHFDVASIHAVFATLITFTWRKIDSVPAATAITSLALTVYLTLPATIRLGDDQ